MKRLLLAGMMLAALSIPALAVNVTITMGPGETFTYVISAASAARFVTWATAAYPTIPNPAYTPTCNCSTTLPNPDPLKSVADATYAGWVANLQSSERAAAQVALSPPAPVN